MNKRPLMLGGLGGACTIIFVWVLDAFFQIQMPDHVAQALSVIITAVMTLWGVEYAPSIVEVKEDKDEHSENSV